MTISFKLRLKIYLRDAFTCRYCGTAFNPLSDDLTLDHINPNGVSTEENLVTACVSCNSRKGARDAQEFKALLEREALSRTSELVLTKDKTPALNEILDMAEEMSGVNKLSIMARNNQRRVVHARTVFAVIARNHGYSYPVIAKFLHKHHTTVLHMVENVAPKVPNCPQVIANLTPFSSTPTTAIREREINSLNGQGEAVCQ